MQTTVMSDSEQEPNATIEEPKGDDGIKHKQVLIEQINEIQPKQGTILRS